MGIYRNNAAARVAPGSTQGIEIVARRRDPAEIPDVTAWEQDRERRRHLASLRRMAEARRALSMDLADANDVTRGQAVADAGVARDVAAVIKSEIREKAALRYHGVGSRAKAARLLGAEPTRARIVAEPCKFGLRFVARGLPKAQRWERTAAEPKVDRRIKERVNAEGEPRVFAALPCSRIRKG